MKSSLAAAIAVTAVGAAALAGSRFGPQNEPTGAWYARLRKPAYTPSGTTIASVWIGLEALLGITGYRLLRRPPSSARSQALGFWSGCLGCLVGFPVVFFGAKRLGAGAAVSATMWGMAVGTITRAWPVDRIAAAATVPLALWTSFASVLSAETWRQNRTLRR